MAENAKSTRSRARSAAAKDADAEGADAKDEAATKAAQEELAAESADDGKAEAEATTTDGGATQPPAPPTGSGEDEVPDAAQSGEPFAKATLIKRADKLLGVSPALAQSQLREAEDPITIDAAKTRIQGFLDGPVANTEEA